MASAAPTETAEAFAQFGATSAVIDVSTMSAGTFTSLTSARSRLLWWASVRECPLTGAGPHPPK